MIMRSKFQSCQPIVRCTSAPSSSDREGGPRQAGLHGAVSCPRGGMSIDTVVFLDIDGVCHQVDDPRGPFRPRCMVQLKKLIHGSGASICLSSSWRESDWGREKVDKYLAAHEMPAVISCTPMPEEGYNTRADEILSWCVAAPPPVTSTLQTFYTPASPKCANHIGAARLLASASAACALHPFITLWPACRLAGCNGTPR